MRLMLCSAGRRVGASVRGRRSSRLASVDRAGGGAGSHARHGDARDGAGAGRTRAANRVGGIHRRGAGGRRLAEGRWKPSREEGGAGGRLTAGQRHRVWDLNAERPRARSSRRRRRAGGVGLGARVRVLGRNGPKFDELQRSLRSLGAAENCRNKSTHDALGRPTLQACPRSPAE
ncbi:hypothetical protein BCR35DRAFT_121568 [Leucosporidium creatinivorum]|uniref:Uncharacterized protein n=1 Tax=Leucosporidium creatinivorum TaxID=106004 RepID=A0A1Y2EY96_9BASI|nr:hypothetical protein BCR35DRAFT_121568 [Leucosporidium creatinivorum]